jgi:hypothetical protein
MPRATVAPPTSQEEAQKKSRAWVIAVAMFIVLALIAGGAFLLTTKPWSQSSEPTSNGGGRTEPSEETTSGASESDNQTLLALIKLERYQESDCKALSSPDGTSKATYDCGALANGPTFARFWLYPSVDTLNDGFAQITGKLQLVNCPKADKAPGDWFYGTSKDKIAGQVGCGTKSGTPALAWTEKARNFMGYIEGSDVTALYKWWSRE